MTKIIDFKKFKDEKTEKLPSDDEYNFEYYMNGNKKVYAISHLDWPFRIHRNGDNIAFVHQETDEPFGVLNASVFNTLLFCWLLVDDPKLMEDFLNKEELK